jgi:hypothetical protein
MHDVNDAVAPAAKSVWEAGILPVVAFGVGGVMLLGGGLMLGQAAVRMCSGVGTATPPALPSFEANALTQVTLAPAATAYGQIKLGEQSTVAL